MEAGATVDPPGSRRPLAAPFVRRCVYTAGPVIYRASLSLQSLTFTNTVMYTDRLLFDGEANVKRRLGWIVDLRLSGSSLPMRENPLFFTAKRWKHLRTLSLSVRFSERFFAISKCQMNRSGGWDHLRHLWTLRFSQRRMSGYFTPMHRLRSDPLTKKSCISWTGRSVAVEFFVHIEGCRQWCPLSFHSGQWNGKYSWGKCLKWLASKEIRATALYFLNVRQFYRHSVPY